MNYERCVKILLRANPATFWLYTRSQRVSQNAQCDVCAVETSQKHERHHLSNAHLKEIKNKKSENIFLMILLEYE